MKILLLSDSVMNANAGGLSQTLYNIFSFIKPENILCISAANSVKSIVPSEPFTNRYIVYNFEIIQLPKNRLAKYIKFAVNWFNYSYNQWIKNFNYIRKQIIGFAPDAVVSCSNGPVGIFMHHKLLAGLGLKNIYPYYMDDWMNQNHFSWLGGNVSGLTKKILSDNTSWIMISQSLTAIFEERYKVKPARLLIMHNPVEIADAPKVLLVTKKEAYTLAYAGSLWPMHFDAFLVVAKAVKILSARRSVRLILYTAEGFWQAKKNILSAFDVIYGGNIPYKAIHQKLSEADCLIVTSSFSKEWYTHSKGSVQTKLTDYLKAQRLIISCGPSYSANHNFLKIHNCGLRIESEDENKAAELINDILDNITSYQEYVENGFELLKIEYSFEQVHQNFIQFISR